MIKILLLVSSIHVGDLNQGDAIVKALSNKSKIETLSIDANQSQEDAREEYLAKLKTIPENDKYITIAVGEKGMELFKYLSDTNSINNKKSYNCLVIHQYFNIFPKLKLNHLIIPEAVVDTPDKKRVINSFPKHTLVFASLGNNLSKKELKLAYDNWKDPNKPSLDKDYIIIMMPGDAPDSSNKMHYFTKESAKELFNNIYKLWVDQGKKHKIIIQNGPRTGKYSPETAKIIANHEYKLGDDPSTAIDDVSRYFVQLFQEMDYSFFNFAIEINGKNRRAISFYNPLLYLAMQNNNIFIIPGASVSSIGQVPLYLPSNRVILFKPSSMNDSHNAIFNLAFKHNYLSYFSSNGEIITPKVITKRSDDDVSLVAKEILIGVYNH
ncbi:MAG: hypothetical protein N4A31_00480 [Rickettsiales bacterium]|jgi:uncharacterized protein YnzC (UPF0291/DUF896 family)|nr:hypothetical protein [Rickettsiales bacterium]